MKEYIHLKIMPDGKFSDNWPEVIEVVGKSVAETGCSFQTALDKTAKALKSSCDNGRAGMLWEMGGKSIVVTSYTSFDHVAEAIFNAHQSTAK